MAKRKSGGSPPPVVSGKQRWRLAAQGFLLGGLFCACGSMLRIWGALLKADDWRVFLVCALVGAAVGATKRRVVLWIGCWAIVALYLLVITTPIAGPFARSLVRRDPFQKVDAIVAINSSVTDERNLDESMFIRYMDALRLCKAGWADRVVITRIGKPYPDPAVDVGRWAELAGGLHVDAVGPVWSTRDEAVKVEELARSRGWSRIILVTSPCHSSRAAATFEKVGLHVISVPATERKLALSKLKGTSERLGAFQWVIYEWVRWALYRARGWV